MTKAFAGIVRLLVIAALAGGVVYNYFQIVALKAEITALRSSRGVAAPAKNSGGKTSARAAESPTPEATFSGLEQHTERAREFLRKQDYEAAKRELEAAAATLRQAGTNASERTARTIEEMRRAVSDLSQKAEQFTGNARRTLHEFQSEQKKSDGE